MSFKSTIHLNFSLSNVSGTLAKINLKSTILLVGVIVEPFCAAKIIALSISYLARSIAITYSYFV